MWTKNKHGREKEHLSNLNYCIKLYSECFIELISLNDHIHMYDLVLGNSNRTAADVVVLVAVAVAVAAILDYMLVERQDRMVEPNIAAAAESLRHHQHEMDQHRCQHRIRYRHHLANGSK